MQVFVLTILVGIWLTLQARCVGMTSHLGAWVYLYQHAVLSSPSEPTVAQAGPIYVQHKSNLNCLLFAPIFSVNN